MQYRGLVAPAFLAGLVISVSACGSTMSGATASPPAVARSGAPATGTPATVGASTTAVASATPAGTAPQSATDAFPLLAGFQGHFAGSWNDTTFATTGAMTWDITVDSTARTVLIKVNVGGNFFGGSGAPPESILLTHLGQGVIAGHSAAFGDVSGTIGPDGTLRIALTGVPGGVVKRVDITGQFSGGSSISMAYSVQLVVGGSASGTVTLARS
jgi:hypothetical protein